MRFSPSLILSLTGLLPLVAFAGTAHGQALYYSAGAMESSRSADQPIGDFGSSSSNASNLIESIKYPQLQAVDIGLTAGANAKTTSVLMASLSSDQAELVTPSFQPFATPSAPRVSSVVPEQFPPVRWLEASPPSQYLAQSTPSSGTPRPGTPTTPTQETPDRIEIVPGPATPTLEIKPPEQPPIPAPVNPAEPPRLPSTSTPIPGSTTEPRVLIAEIAVSGTDNETLQNAVYDAVKIRPGQTTTQSELQQDVNAVFATGFFSRVGVTPEDTPLGVRVTFVVVPNPVLTRVQVENRQVLPDGVIDRIFSPQYGRILNLRDLQTGIKQLNEWYQGEGYVLAQVIDRPDISSDGVVTLDVAEGVIEDIKVQFLNKDGEPKDEQGNPIRGRTRDFIVTREFDLMPGQVFQRSKAEADLQRVFGLGIFDDVRLSLNPGSNPRQVVVVANVIERSTGSVAAGAGISSASGLFGTVSYQEQNFGGNNQKLGAEFQLGERETLFDISFTDPWIGGDPFRTSYSVNAFNRRSISLVFDGGPNQVFLPNGDVPRIDRLGAGLTFTRPYGNWTLSAGAQYQLVTTRDFNRNIQGTDQFGNPLTFSRSGVDDIYSFQIGAVQDLRNDRLRPTGGSLLRLGMEQTIPLGQGSILYNRIRGSYSYYVPVSFLRLSDGPQALAFNVQAGTVLGDLPPYEAFALGGVNSVRGYEEGALGSGRSFVQATAEYRFPIFSIIGGAAFLDVASDLGSGSSVIGNPAGVRGKPGSGYGYGIGLRVQTPLGPLRIDYGINDLGSSRIHFGIGERF